MKRRVLESNHLGGHGETANLHGDSGMIALRNAAAAYGHLRDELTAERALGADLARRLDDARRRSELEEKRVASLLDSIRSLRRALYAGTAPGPILRAAGELCEPGVESLPSAGPEAEVVVEDVRLRDGFQGGYVTTIAVLADAVHAKDPYTHGHCEQVSAYARRAALRLGLSDTELRITCYAALLHDVGKIGVSDRVLNKPGPLIAEERKLVEAHVRIGHDLLNVVPALRDIASAVLYHHERYDGCGYPEGLAGERIPMASRIVAVVDAYCAMIDVRSYKEAYSPEHARAELIRCSGTQFDPEVVQAVLAAIDEVDGTVQACGMWESGCGVLPPLREYSAYGDSG